tara:strand:- start:515 stop:736 length:222 start_codon:yes stop_codon:yes gene_type:complete
MITKKEIVKSLGKDKAKLMAVDFDSCGFAIWLKEPFVFAVNQSGYLGWDYDQLEESGGKQECLDEISQGITTR